MQKPQATTIVQPGSSILYPTDPGTGPSLAPPIGRRRAQTRRRARVLLAEDDAELRHALKARLFHHGFDVTAVFDGVSARWSLLSCRYDAVVLDLGLPKSHGLDVMTEVGCRKKLPPIVVLTGGDEHEQDLAMTFGASLVLQKPCPFKELASAIDRLLVP